MSKSTTSIFNIAGVFRALGYSISGLRAAFKNERAFRQEVVLFIILAPLAYWLGETVIERSLLIGVLLLVMVVELFNSAIESIVDRIGSERHELSGRAKDMGSSAVLLSITLVIVVWSMILIPKYF